MSGIKLLCFVFFSELLEVDYEIAELLYTAYAVNDENYAKIINGFSNYSL